MPGVLVNTLTVILGSLIGLAAAGHIKEKYTSAVMTAVGLCTLYIGIDGALKGENTLVLILSMALGAAVGTLLDLDGRINAVGAFFEKRFSKGEKKVSVTEGFVTASLLFCIGSMTVVGSLQAGLTGDNTLLYTKAVLDLISSCILASTLGIGVLLAAAFVLVFQGALVLAAGLLAPLLTETVQAEMICAGSVMIIALGLNLIGLTKIKAANLLPALVFAAVLTRPMNDLAAYLSTAF